MNGEDNLLGHRTARRVEMSPSYPSLLSFSGAQERAREREESRAPRRKCACAHDAASSPPAPLTRPRSREDTRFGGTACIRGVARFLHVDSTSATGTVIFSPVELCQVRFHSISYSIWYLTFPRFSSDETDPSHSFAGRSGERRPRVLFISLEFNSRKEDSPNSRKKRSC